MAWGQAVMSLHDIYMDKYMLTYASHTGKSFYSPFHLRNM